jgi:hypothetical protein
MQTGDRVRYRGRRYYISGIIKLYDPARIRVLTAPLGSKWREIPGDHTVVLEQRHGYH